MIMALVMVDGPAVPVVTLQDMWAHLRLYPCGSPESTPDDALLLSFAQMATDELDGARGWLGRALIDQTWQLSLPRFPVCPARLALPLTSPRWDGGSPAPTTVLEVRYVDPEGVETVMAEGVDYDVVTGHDPQYIRPLYGRDWPATRCQADAVRVTYRAGYGASAEDVPAVVRSYILLRVGQFFEYRELVGAAAAVAPVPYMRDMLESVRLRGYVCAPDV